MGTSLAELQSTNFKTTRHADERNNALREKLGLRTRYEPARLAIARSLSLQEPPLAAGTEDDDESGKVIKGENLFGTGGELATWVSLIVEHGQLVDATKKDIQEAVRRHWHRGIDLLWTEWSECQEDFDNFISRLAERAGVREGRSEEGAGSGTVVASGSSGPVPIGLRLGDVGVIEETGAVATWTLNLSGQSPHFGIFGGSGKGKTMLAKALLAQVAAHGVPILLIDPKGDLKDDKAFARSINATVVNVGQDAIPLDSLLPTGEGERAVIHVADGFVEAIAKAVPDLGPKQQDTLREVAKKVIGAGGSVSFETIVQAVDARYKANKQRTDALTATLHRLRDHRLFEPRLSPEEFFSQSWIISLNGVRDDAARFTMLFLLHTMWGLLRESSDTEVDRKRGVRKLRLMLVIDEAKRAVDVASPTMLEDIVLQGRSKGLSCFFLSQSPDHLDRASDDIVRQFEVVATFQTEISAKSTRRVLGPRATPDMVQDLKMGTCLARLPGHDDPVVVRVWQPVGG